MYGIVFSFAGRGYGFIRQSSPDQEDLFFHVSELTFPPEQVRKGLPVEFEVGKHKGKPVARNVRLLESGADDEQA